MLYPQQNAARAVMDLSGVWSFRAAQGDEGFRQGWAARPLEHAITMAVPGSYNDQKADPALREHDGWVFYQRAVCVPRALHGERIVVRFGAATHHAQVFWNGVKLCEHKGGFLPFEVELTGEQGLEDGLLTVAVDNRIDGSTLPVGSEGTGMRPAGAPPETGGWRGPQNHPNFDFFNYAGLSRPVKLYTTPRAYIADLALVPSLDGADAVVEYRVETVGEGATGLIVRDARGAQVACAEGPSGRFTIPSANLWEPGAGYLYTAQVCFGMDLYAETFGVRTVEVRGDRFLLNGKPFYFKGFGKHEDSEIHGRGLDETLNVKDLALMKWMGANSLRTSHYPCAEEMYALCDREGIVVIDEAPAVGVDLNTGAPDGTDTKHTFRLVGTEGHHHDVVRDMIARDKNHPCVVMWSIASGADTTAFPEEAAAYCKPIYDLAHRLDPQNRPVTMAGLQNEYRRDQIMPQMDVICLNRYYGWYGYGGELEAARAALCEELSYWCGLGKPVMFTEYGADAVAGLHASLPTLYSEEYQVRYYAMHHGVFDEYPSFVGEQTSNFADFQTAQGVLQVDGGKKGVFTRERRPKLAAHALRKRWTAIPDFGYQA